MMFWHITLYFNSGMPPYDIRTCLALNILGYLVEHYFNADKLQTNIMTARLIWSGIPLQYPAASFLYRGYIGSA